MLANLMLPFVGATVSLTGLGLATGFSPTLLAVTVDALTRSQRRMLLIGAIVGGIAAGSTLLVLLFQVIDPHTIEAVLRGRVEAVLVHRSVDFVAGLAFLAAGVWSAIRARRPRVQRPHPVSAEHPRTLFTLAAANSVISVSGVATMYVTGRLVRGVSHDVLMQLAAYAIFLIALAAPYLLIGWAWGRFPDGADRLTSAVRWFTGRDLRPALAVALLLVGAVMVLASVTGYFGTT